MPAPNKFLTPQSAYIFRITHVANLPWIIEHGLHCCNSSVHDPAFIVIGNPDVIDRRDRRNVPITPFGTLSDYVPFYFTPWSIMLCNIVTGHGVPMVSRSDIIMLVARLTALQDRGIAFVHTDRHALLTPARFFNGLEHLSDVVDWAILQKRDFSRDNADPGKLERYMAEALVHKYLPFDALGGIACATDETKTRIISCLQERNLNVKVSVQVDWFF